MSSSDEFPNWSLFSEREQSLSVDLLAPALEVATLLQKHRAELDLAHQESEEARRAGLEALAEQAVFVIQMSGALERYEQDFIKASLVKAHRHLRVLKDQMLDTLSKAGIEAEIPLLKPFDEVAESVHIEGWRHRQEYTAEVVAEVIEPIIKHKGELVRMGRVVMGAPLEMAIKDERAEGA
jgi:hypothetical protein